MTEQPRCTGEVTCPAHAERMGQTANPEPKPSEVQRLKLHHRAMQVIPPWMADGNIVLDIDGIADSLCLGATALRELDRRFKAAFEQDEAVRADLLAACEAVLTLFEPRSGLPNDIATTFRQIVSRDPVLQRVRAAIAEARVVAPAAPAG